MLSIWHLIDANTARRIFFFNVIVKINSFRVCMYWYSEHSLLFSEVICMYWHRLCSVPPLARFTLLMPFPLDDKHFKWITESYKMFRICLNWKMNSNTVFTCSNVKHLKTEMGKNDLKNNSVTYFRFCVFLPLKSSLTLDNTSIVLPIIGWVLMVNELKFDVTFSKSFVWSW